ncbi:MAG: DUF2779 domain-containing protein [Candidatus Marinimicrobia bacterium]|nr:DUF2779 domain-containing protein [Candidatus Neomarinimicrobiota bacterium]
MKINRLSKSKYLSGLQCHKRLWLEIHKPELAPPPPPGEQRIFDQGTKVGELATEEFPDGVLIEADYLNIPEAVKQTEEALDNSVDVIFEGCFIFENVLVRPDIILRNDLGSWNMIEVKSSTGVKEVNIHDVAVQTWVLRGSGLEVKRVFLKHINRDCVYPDLSNLFRTDDITEPVNAVLPAIPKKLSEYKSMLDKSEPNVSIGEHCSNPYDCQFSDYCWKDVPEHSIFTIPRLRWSVKERLIERNKITINDLSAEFPLNENQQKYIKSLEGKKPIVDRNGIKGELDKLEYPLHFLDFETDGPAIPRFDGLHPYEQFPFQYSCHILDQKGNLEHKEYLQETESDPRKSLIESLVAAIGDKGSVIAYNAGFEKGVMNKLAQWCPEYSEQLQSIIGRLWDQLVIFRKYYTDYRFKGSNSLKKVLPVMVPSMSYENLDVSDGIEAQVTWNEMIQLPDGGEKSKLIKELKEYCGQDTLAMIMIHKRLCRK